MSQKGVSLVSVLIALALVGGAVAIGNNTQSPNTNNQRTLAAVAMASQKKAEREGARNARKLDAIERQLLQAQKRGVISHASTRVLDRKLKELESKGVSTSAARETLTNLVARTAEKKTRTSTTRASPPKTEGNRQVAGNTNRKSPSQFAAAKEEIEKAQKSGSRFPKEHSDRVLRDLTSFEAAGQAKSEIDRLRKIVQGLSPHIGDAARAAAAAETEAAKAAAKKACAETVPPVLTADITDLSKVQNITAPGSSSREGPKGHSFINTNHARVPLYAPVAAIYDSGSYTKDSPESPAQYLLFFRVKEGCGFQFKFDHADEIVPSLTDELFTATPKVADSRTAPTTKTIEFAAGELIGYTRGTPQAGNWDFGLYNMNEEGKLAAHGSYATHRYSVCWPDFYSPEKKERYRKLLEGPRLVCSF